MDAVADALKHLKLQPPTKAEGRKVQVHLRIFRRDIAATYTNALDEVIALTSHDSPVTFVARDRFTEDSLFTRPVFRVVLWLWDRYDSSFKEVFSPHEDYETHNEFKWYSFQPDEYANASRGQLTHHLFIDYSGKPHEQEQFAELDYESIVNDPHLMVFEPETVLQDPHRVLTHALNRAIDWVHSCVYNTTWDLAAFAEPKELPAEYTHTVAVGTRVLREESLPAKWNHQDNRVEVQHTLQDHPWVDTPPDQLLTNVLSRIDE